MAEFLNVFLRDPTNVNAMKQTCVMVILAFSLIPVEICAENNQKVIFRTLNLGVKIALAKSNVKDVISANNVDINKTTDKMLIPGCNILPRNILQTNLHRS